ncbi:MAG: helix-turn-helix transcriptional regulator [Bacteroidota bacterium]
MGEISLETRIKARKSAEISYRIDVLRKKKGWDKGELARQAKMPQSQLTRIISGNANLTIETIERLEIALEDIILTIPDSPIAAFEERKKNRIKNGGFAFSMPMASFIAEESTDVVNAESDKIVLTEN